MQVFSLHNKDIAKLVGISKQLRHLASVAGLLSWDQETYLPPHGAYARAGQLETIAQITHERATAKSLGNLLSRLQEKIAVAPESFTQHDKTLVKLMDRDSALATKVPKKLVSELSRHCSISLEMWKSARTQNSFSFFEKSLTKMIELKQQVAYCYGYTKSPYDALLGEYEEGLTSDTVQSMFDKLETDLRPLLVTLSKKTAPWDKQVFHQHFDEKILWDVTVAILEKLGFVMDSGRQDQSTHPFTMGISPHDVRLTTRLLATKPLSSILSSIHEGGHGMYEQGIHGDIWQTRIGVVDSLVLHESQSRLYENMIGKSSEFWQYFFPLLAGHFPAQLSGVSALDAYKEVNVVAPSLIRVDADEVSYHFHILIRFLIEKGLIEGTMRVSDVPEIWKSLYAKYLGVDVPDDLHGSLQDIHWSQGLIGYFPTYSLGSFLSAGLFATLQKEIPDIMNDVARGTFNRIHDWLAAHIHTHGRLFTSEELSFQVTGKNSHVDAYLLYIKNKFSIE